MDMTKGYKKSFDGMIFRELCPFIEFYTVNAYPAIVMWWGNMRYVSLLKSIFFSLNQSRSSLTLLCNHVLFSSVLLVYLPVLTLTCLFFFSGGWGYGPRFQELRQQILAEVQEVEVTGAVGRRSKLSDEAVQS